MRQLIWLTLASLAACSDDTANPFDRDADVSAIGAACGGAFACPDGLICVGAPGSETSRCMTRCDFVGALCPGGPLCVELVDGSGGVCYLGGNGGRGAECTSSLECQTGMGCVGAMTRYCTPLCQAADGAGCAADDRCIPLNDEIGRCVDRLGSRCEADAECGDARLTCQLGEDPWWPFANSCSLACATDADCGGDGVCLKSGEASFCADGCARDGHCRVEDGFACRTNEVCEGWANEAECRAMIGANRICIRPG